MKIRLHVNRFELAKGAEGKPWTIHTSGRCIPARDVKIEAPCRTEHRPELRSNPRVFLTCENVRILPLGNDKYVIT